MAYSIQGPELEGGRGTVEVTEGPHDCPLCAGPADVTSTETGMNAWIIIRCLHCGLQIAGRHFHIYHHCACDEFKRMCEMLIKRWNTRI